MRVLMAAACPLPWARGTPIRIHRMAEALTGRGHDVQVVTYPLGDPSKPVPYRIYRVARHYRRLDPKPGPSLAKALYLDPQICAKLTTLLRSEHFDLLHAHHYEGLIASLCARRLSRRIPIVYDAHTLLHSELPYYNSVLPPRWLASVGTALDRALPPRADHVIAVSARIHEWLVRDVGLDPDRISIIPNGVEVEHFAGDAAVSPAREVGANIVFAGNLAEYQGMDLLLQAFARILTVEGNARLSLFTHSPPDEVISLSKAFGVAHAVVFDNPDYASLPSRLAEADVLVNPRINCDGIPQKLLNYMATGRPIVSFRSSAQLLKHEENALVVADGDVQGFAAAVLRFLREPSLGQSLGQAAKTKVAAESSWEKVAERVESAYERTMESRR